LNRFMETPTMTHFKVLKWIIQYIKGTVDFGLLYGYSNSFEIVGYSDSDWVENMNDRKSTMSFFSIWETQHSHGVQKNNLYSLCQHVKLNM
jgi:hypothetical protein